ncbi:quinone oxidoreductase [Streptomyces sp. HPF1205]|uniref:quinone oxidoreductase family protein n=1 Tax=Streptomyces sp. HPF1205 TaxID=2873262 RepID=UPI001CED3D94|nr:quinone oxidoreductase [Streptomyces sp. HPF1205]
MRAVVAERHGGPEVLAEARRPDPEPGPADLLVRLTAAGVNFKDVYEREGRGAPRAPFVPGSEGAGTVVAAGPQAAAAGFRPGDRVAWCTAPASYAELVAVPAVSAVRVPDGIDDTDAAAIMLQGITAHYLTTSTYQAAGGETALVHSAAGGLGRHLVRLLAHRGVRVIGTVSSAGKTAAAEAAGASDVIVREEGGDLAGRVRELTGGRGVDVVYDGIGRDTFDAGLASLRKRGTYVLVGTASGTVPPFDPQSLAPRGSLFLTRPTLADHVGPDGELAGRAADVFRWLDEGVLSTVIGGRYAFGKAAQAHADLQSGTTTGKLLLDPAN